MASLTHRWDILSDGSLALYPPPGLQLGMVKTTKMQKGVSRPTLRKDKDFNPARPADNWVKGMPDTWDYVGVNTEQNNHVLLTEALQWHWFRECVKRDPGHPNNERDNWYYDRQFNSLTDDDLVQTNRFGSETCAVYPTGKNIGKQPMRFFTITEGLAVLQILGGPKNVLGAQRYPFKTINANAPLAGTTFEEFPWGWFAFMNSVRTPILNAQGKWPNGVPVYKEDGYQRFDHFNRKAIAPLYMPHASVGWIDASYIQLLDPEKPIPMLFNM
jgi:hypothetical protein